MLVTDLRSIGNRLHYFRKNAGKTQAEIAEVANLSDRAYADIERGTVNMRVETLLGICHALRITPDELLTHDDREPAARGYELIARLQKHPEKVQKAAYDLIEVYLNSLD